VLEIRIQSDPDFSGSGSKNFNWIRIRPHLECFKPAIKTFFSVKYFTAKSFKLTSTKIHKFIVGASGSGQNEPDTPTLAAT
jgi:hypothetical protein